MELTEEDLGGRPDCCSPVQSIARNPKKVSDDPVLCRRCQDSEVIYRMSGHPDDGTKRQCDIKMENKREGCMYFSCPYFKPVPCAPVIDAEKLQAHARILTGPESPHPYIDPLLSGERMIRKERELTPREYLENMIAEIQYDLKVVEDKIGSLSMPGES